MRQIVEIGLHSQLVVVITGAFTGAVFAAQTYFQFNKLGMGSAVGAVVSVSVCRELGPVLTALMVTGRVGAAMSAEIERLTSSMHEIGFDGLAEGQARIVAEALAIGTRVRQRRRDIMEQLSPCHPMSGKPPVQQINLGTKSATPQGCALDELLRLERYEWRAMSRKNKTAHSIAALGKNGRDS